MYKRYNKPGPKVRFEVTPRGWESPAADLKRKLGAVLELNRLLMLDKAAKESTAEQRYYQLGLHGRYYEVHSPSAYRIIKSQREDLAEMHTLCLDLRRALEAARAKLVEQDSIIEKLVIGRSMSC